MTIHYDAVGDILFLETRRPYADQDSEELADEIVVRWNPDTGAVDRIEILFLSRRSPEDASIAALPMEPALREIVTNLMRYAQAA